MGDVVRAARHTQWGDGRGAGGSTSSTGYGRGRARWLRVALAAALALHGVAGAAGCAGRMRPGVSDGDASSFDEWMVMAPYLEATRGFVAEATHTALEQAMAPLRKGRAQDADAALAAILAPADADWIAIGRANVAALYFTTCIRGVALRLTNAPPDDSARREVDFREQTQLQEGDVDVPSTLDALDRAQDRGRGTPLGTHAMIARARMAAFLTRCPASEAVAGRLEQTLETDLAALAALRMLTPDLAYVWGGLTLQRYSGDAAEPFLREAQAGGFEHPTIPAMLAMILLERRDFAGATAQANAANEAFERLDDADGRAEALFILGEIDRIRGDVTAAAARYAEALALAPRHVHALLRSATLQAAGAEDEAVEFIAQQVVQLLGEASADEERARQAQAVAEQLVIAVDGMDMARLVRRGLLHEIDDDADPLRRCLRYLAAAMLDVRVGDTEMALGHAAFARQELRGVPFEVDIDIDGFLEQANATLPR